MTIAEKKKYGKYAGIAALVLFIIFVYMRKKPQKDDTPPPTPLWYKIENIVFGLMLVLAAIALFILAPVIPFIAPWIMYVAGIGVLMVAAYQLVMRWGSSDSILPDPLPNPPNNVLTNNVSILDQVPTSNDLHTV
jgi:hypothetical protein